MLQGTSRPGFLGMGLLAGLALIGCGGSGGGRPGATGGSTGSGGAATGTGGTTTGSGGATGAAGAAAALPCTGNPTIPLITNFGSAAGDGGVSANGSWGTTGQLTGTVFGYTGAVTNEAGVQSKVTAAIDKTAGHVTLSGTVNPADYAGGGMAFATCVDSTSWTGIRFTLGGTADGCNITFQLQTESQEPPSNKGTCPGSCYNFPQLAVTIPATAGTPTVVKFSDLMATGMPANPADFEKEMFGLQWQFTSAAPTADGSAQLGCMPAMTISDVEWITN
jgi:hypothetical protein